ncbi:hypothetical protein BH11MYX4_BH11MYX4_04380 [soil metagenome]
MTEKRTYERMRERDAGLGPWSERAVRAVIEALFAREGEDGEVTPPPAERVTWVTREIDDFLARATTRSYAIVLLSLVVVNVVAPLLSRRFGSLAGLSPRQRVHALERFEKSGFAPALLAVKALLSVHYYEHPDAAREVGYDGACLVPSAPPHALEGS